jgi:RNA-directed DNA polymerase
MRPVFPHWKQDINKQSGLADYVKHCVCRVLLEFTSPFKRTGRVAPTPKLKALQRRLAISLYECLSEIETAHKTRKSLSHAFRKSHSIITNARPHRKRRYVLNLDLENFFPSLNFGRVRGYFLKNNDFKLSEPAATIIAQIACYKDVLPQGSPCSPIISELLTHFFDVRLARLAKHYKCTYSRYADDLSFSTNQATFPAALAIENDGVWTLGKSLVDRIADSGFSINNNKTRMQCRGSRQTVTGLTVNEKVNIRADYYRSARAMADSFFTNGHYHRGDEVKVSSIRQIEGILNHIYHVKERAVDSHVKEQNDEKKTKDRIKEKYANPSAILKLYRKLLFFKNFLDLDKPLILCEGKTDVIYLRSAIRKLTEFHPKLANLNQGAITFNVRFFKYSAQAHDVLKLGGGTGDLKHFLLAFQEHFAEFNSPPIPHPVILLIDNDDGTDSVFPVIKNKFHVTADLKTDLPFYHLWENLFLVKTPAKGAAGKSFIEECFPPALMQTLIEGKKFSLDKKHNAPNERAGSGNLHRAISGVSA